ncbi:hypothetical protein AcW1_006541 [Taiwanofungus camphoratus]|nr:hypothetical protein AcW1_006541 [Antrodia cinnamomea]
MRRAPDIFFEQLYSLSHGSAQWYPEVDGLSREVLIGDVGCIIGEAFRPLFNVTLPAGHKYNQR